jgi:hypothetical protein
MTAAGKILAQNDLGAQTSNMRCGSAFRSRIDFNRGIDRLVEGSDCRARARARRSEPPARQPEQGGGARNGAVRKALARIRGVVLPFVTMTVARTIRAASSQVLTRSRSRARRMFGVAGLIASRAALARCSNSVASSSIDRPSMMSLMVPPFAALPVDLAMLARPYCVRKVRTVNQGRAASVLQV